MAALYLNPSLHSLAIAELSTSRPSPTPSASSIEILDCERACCQEMALRDQLISFLEILNSSPDKHLVYTKFEQLDPKLKELLYIAAWDAYGQPLGDFRFGERILKNDIFILKNIRAKSGENIVKQLLNKMTLFIDSSILQTAIQITSRMVYPGALTLEQADDLFIEFANIHYPHFTLPEKDPRGYSHFILRDIQTENSLETVRKRLLSPLAYPTRAVVKQAVLAQSLLPGCERSKKVLMVSYECSKIFKYGGLGEAVYGIGKNLVEKGHKVDLILPKLDATPASLPLEAEQPIAHEFKGTEKIDRVFKTTLDGMTVHLLEDTVPADDPTYVSHFDLKGMHNFYEDGPLARPDCPWFGLKERFAYLGDSVSQYVYDHRNEYDAVIFHDWHAAWAIDLLARKQTEEWQQGHIPALGLVIHNNNYGCQGVYTGQEKLIPGFFGEQIEGMNVMTRAMTWADHVITVSPSFAMEMQSKTLGAGIEDKVRDLATRGRLTGILNGSNPDLWDPKKDATLKNWKDPVTGDAIDLSYDPCSEDVFEKKALIKEQLQKWIEVYHPEWIEETGIDMRKGETILYVGRYDSSQKGLDQFSPAMQKAHEMGVNFVCMGVASPKDERAQEILDTLEIEANGFKEEEGGKGLVIRDVRNAENRLQIQQGSSTVPGVGSLFRAATDFTYFPSEFEPCGLVQYEGWLFGSLAIASNTGGLSDTVIDDPDSPYFNGFKFERCARWHSEEQSEKVKETVEKAIRFGRETPQEEKKQILQRAYQFAKQSSWTSSPTGEMSPIDQYVRVIDTMITTAQNRDFSLRRVTV